LIILRNVLGSRARKCGPGTADYKILLYATPKSTIKLISSLKTCNIFPPSRLGDTRVPLNYALHECECVSSSGSHQLGIYGAYAYIRLLSYVCPLSRIYIYSIPNRGSFSFCALKIPPKFAPLYSICKNIQVRLYSIVSTVKKFYTFSLEYGMQSDRLQHDLRRSKANPDLKNASETLHSATSIGHMPRSVRVIIIIRHFLVSISPL